MENEIYRVINYWMEHENFRLDMGYRQFQPKCYVIRLCEPDDFLFPSDREFAICLTCPALRKRRKKCYLIKPSSSRSGYDWNTWYVSPDKYEEIWRYILDSLKH